MKNTKQKTIHESKAKALEALDADPLGYEIYRKGKELRDIILWNGKLRDVKHDHPVN